MHTDTVESLVPSSRPRLPPLHSRTSVTGSGSGRARRGSSSSTSAAESSTRSTGSFMITSAQRVKTARTSIGLSLSFVSDACKWKYLDRLEHNFHIYFKFYIHFPYFPLFFTWNITYYKHKINKNSSYHKNNWRTMWKIILIGSLTSHFHAFKNFSLIFLTSNYFLHEILHSL